MAVTQRLTPTLYDKLVADLEISGMRDMSEEAPEISREKFRYYSVPRLERFNETALRATIRRDLAWLFNTTNLESLVDLEPYPNVRDSVLNYGLTDLAGQTLNRRAVLARAREIRRAVRLFEPRLSREGLTVDPIEDNDDPHALTFLIQGDITAAAQTMPVKFRTEIEAETATVNVRE
jgi:type VI secretion system protein ImpF